MTKARIEKPNLIFLDILMPDQDGFRTCRELAGDLTTKDIPVVFVTHKNQKAGRVWVPMQGTKGCIIKPFAAHEIADQIKSLL